MLGKGCTTHPQDEYLFNDSCEENDAFELICPAKSEYTKDTVSLLGFNLL